MTRVLIVDDHVAVRAGLRSVLRLAPSVEVVASVPDRPAALAAVGGAAIDVALVDYQLRDGDGLALCRAMKRIRPSLATALYTAHDARGFAVVAAVAGVEGVLDKGAPAEDLIAAIEAIAAGRVLQPERSPDAVRDAGRRLPAEDLPVLGLRIAGTRERDVADALDISVDEVQRRIDSIVERLRPRPRRATPSPRYGRREAEDAGFSPSRTPRTVGTIGL